MPTVNSDPFFGFNKDDGKKRDVWEIENILPSMPYIRDLGSAITSKDGHWYVQSAYHTPNTYGELVFWDWLARSCIDTDRLGVSGSKIGIHQYSPGSTWEYEDYQRTLNNSYKHGLSLGSPPWMNKYNFYTDMSGKPIETVWVVPVQADMIVEGGRNSNDFEINTGNRIKKIGWALWRVTREFNGRVGFFNGSFMCSDETDAVVLSPYCEMLGVLRSVPREATKAESLV